MPIVSPCTPFAVNDKPSGLTVKTVSPPFFPPKRCSTSFKSILILSFSHSPDLQKNTNLYTLIGGKVKENEKFDDAIIREVKEELFIDLKKEFP